MIERTKLIALASVLLFFSGRALAQTRIETFNVANGGRLETAVLGNIRVSPSSTNEVVVKAEVNAPDFLSITQTGNTVRVEYRPPSRSGDRVRFEITAPVTFDLDLMTNGGNIEVAGPITGTTELRSNGGNLRTGDLNGPAELNTNGGNISTGNISGEANIRTAGGNIQIGNVGQSLNARTSGGNIETGNIGGDANVETAGGNIAVQEVAGRAALRTSGGNIRLSAANGNVEARTSGGNIELLKVVGAIQASTSGGNISAELTPDGAQQSVLTTPAGNIELHMPPTAQASVEAEIKAPGRDNRIRSDFTPESSTQQQGGTLRAAYRLNGGGQRIRVETGSGDVEVRALR